MLLASIVSVALSAHERVREHVPKKEAPAFSVVEPIVFTMVSHGDDLVAYFDPAILPNPVMVPAGTIEYLKIKKPLLLSADVDRKWVWWYSIITNS